MDRRSFRIIPRFFFIDITDLWTRIMRRFQS